MSESPNPQAAGPEPMEEREQNPERQEAVEDNPLPLNALLSTQVRRHLVDFFLTTAQDDARLSKRALSQATDITRHAINDHIDDLVKFGVVRNDGSESRPQYSPNVGHPVYEQLVVLNDLLYASWMDELDE